MKVLVLGSGGREHALFWKIRQSPMVDRVYAAPGNGATQALFANITINPADPAEVLALVHEHDIDLVVIGPDAAVAAGVADALIEAGRQVFGPTAAAGRVESSKAYAKGLMGAAGIPTATYSVFDDRRKARDYARAHPEGLVVKADGLALGKGVTVCDSVSATLAAIDRAMREGAFGEAGLRLILEERLSGNEVSLMCFCDGTTAVPMPPARDYKRAHDGDQGPNTGGMGGYSPPADVDVAMVDWIVRTCAQPLVDELASRGTPYRGCLYTQVMLTEDGPRVIEFNARFGDPEAQVVLPRLSSDLVEPLLACAQGDLGGVRPQWDSQATVGVVLASGGYPGQYRVGFPIEGLDSRDSDVIAFHSGTRRTPHGYITSGGRVLTLVATGATVAEARDRAYANVRRVSFEGSFYRSDVALVETSAAALGSLTAAAPD
ncbi:MAG TPA: phosphoribosylamine--glycine ligase [Candidatus Dormibacteraeota bacterium]|nr:phosphoribosylamine--glycine ligase [Candidatus Dormibacteraeota bacterium]